MKRCTVTASLELPDDVEASDVLELAAIACGGDVRRVRVYAGDQLPSPPEDERARGVREWPAR